MSGNCSPQTPYRGFAPGRYWETSVPRPPGYSLINEKSLHAPLLLEQLSKSLSVSNESVLIAGPHVPTYRIAVTDASCRCYGDRYLSDMGGVVIRRVWSC